MAGPCHPDDLPEGYHAHNPGAELGKIGRRFASRAAPGLCAW